MNARYGIFRHTHTTTALLTRLLVSETSIGMTRPRQHAFLSLSAFLVAVSSYVDILGTSEIVWYHEKE